MACPSDKKPAGFFLSVEKTSDENKKNRHAFCVRPSPCAPPRTSAVVVAPAGAAPPIGAPPAWLPGPFTYYFAFRYAPGDMMAVQRSAGAFASRWRSPLPAPAAPAAWRGAAALRPCPFASLTPMGFDAAIGPANTASAADYSHDRW